MKSGFEIGLEKIIRVENEIQLLLTEKSGVTAHFVRAEDTLYLITYNPTHDESFLLCSSHCHHKWDLNNMSHSYGKLLGHVKELVETPTNKKTLQDFTYTVVWCKSDGAVHTSYFYGEDMSDVLEKFYFGKEDYKSSYNILQIKKNPTS